VGENMTDPERENEPEIVNLGKKKFGFKKTYKVVGCNMTVEPIIYSFPYNDQITIEILIAPNLRYKTIYADNQTRYVLPGDESYIATLKEITNEEGSGILYTEIICLIEYEEIGPEKTPSINFDEKTSEFDSIINFFAGIIGLRFHRQLVLEIVSDNSYYFGEKGQYSSITSGTEWMEILKHLTFTKDNQEEFIRILRNVVRPMSEEKRRKNALIMRWLLHAWHDHDDIVDRFVSFFTPIEMILKGYPGDGNKAESPEAVAILELIQNHGGTDSEKLTGFFNGFLKPSLVSRFEQLAKEANFPTKTDDIKAFKAFYRVRNAVLHKGNPDIAMQLSINKREVKELENLTLKYVSYHLFGDPNFFQSALKKDMPESPV
jgi:hypothetical protein